MNPYPSKKVISRVAGCAIAIACLMLLSTYIYYHWVFTVNPGYLDDMRRMLVTQERATLYSFYANYEPDSRDSLFYGSPDAQLTMVAYMDPGSESARYFMRTVFPLIEEEFISPGKLRFYPRDHINIADNEQDSESFIYARSLACMRQLKPKNYFDFYFGLFNTTTIGQIKLLSVKYGVLASAWDACLLESPPDYLSKEMLEVEWFGMTAIQPRFYLGINGKDNSIIDGVPDYERFRSVLRTSQLLIGQ